MTATFNFPGSSSTIWKEHTGIGTRGYLPITRQRGHKMNSRIQWMLIIVCEDSKQHTTQGTKYNRTKAISADGTHNKWANQILDYCATNPDAKIQYQASNMQLKIHSDASYLNEPNARSSFAGYHFLGWNQKEGEPLKLNGCLNATMGILKLVVASAAESEFISVWNLVLG